MKIISQGNLAQAIKRYRFGCRLCGCVFECEDDEVRKELGSHNGTMYTYECPRCSETVYGQPIAYR